MEELRKKNLKSIVAQRLALFNALESGRPRSDTGSPQAYTCDQFIFNRGISQEIVSDFQKVNTLKSPTRKEVFEGLENNKPIYENMETIEKGQNSSGGEPRSTEDVITASFSVRQLRRIFETSSVPLTARNSLGEEAPNLVSNSSQRTTETPNAEFLSYSDVPRQDKKGLDEKKGLSTESPKQSPLIKKKPVPQPNEFANSRQAKTLPATSGSKPEPFATKTLSTDRKLQEANDKNETMGEKVARGPPLPPKGQPSYLSHKAKEDSQSCSPPSRFPPSKPLPQLPNRDETEKPSRFTCDKENKGGVSSPRKDIGAVGSVYIEPTCKAEKDAKNSVESSEKLETVPMKKRTLGRGDIKPYEIVSIVTPEKGNNNTNVTKDYGRQHSSKMESMYVQTFGDLDGKITKEKNEDGYEEIVEYSEPEGRQIDELDTDEIDLSNLDFKSEEVTSIGEQKEKERFTRQLEERNTQGQSSNGEYEEIPTKAVFAVSFDEDELTDDTQSYSSSIADFRSRSLDSSALSMHEDISETWESDEFDEYTDDEILDEPKHRKKTTDGDTSKKKISNIVNEILATEKAYAKRLNLLDKVFQARLLKEAKENAVVPEKVVQEIFSNLSSICTFHNTILLPDLEKRITNWSSNEKIGDIFKTLGHCLKLYTDYVKNFEHATNTLTQWMKKSPKFASVIEELQKLPECENLTLQHHMLEPIQRVPRYKLLLQDYLKKLPKDSPDRAEAEESLVVISEAANHSNNSMKGMDKFKKLVEIEERIVEGLRGESLATASRVFIREGELVKIAARSDQKQARILLLFNDLVLCCNKIPATGKLKVRQMMEIPGMSVQDGDEVDLGDVNTFRIRSRQRVLDLAASSPEEKHDWIQAISGVMKDYEAKRGSLLKQYMEEEAQKETFKGIGTLKVGDSAPVWVKDEDVTMCMLCAVRFSLLSRRHHCRACGRIVCDNCSKYRAQLSYMNNTIKRVCYVCNVKLNAGKLQETDSFIQKSFTLAQVNRDPKRRRSTIVSEVQGELHWKPPGKGWMKGYFSIADMVLYVQKGKKDPKAQMTIALPGYAIARPSPEDEIDEAKYPFVFKLHSGNKKEFTYYFQADNEDMMQRWIDVIKYSIKAEKPPQNYKTL